MDLKNLQQLLEIFPTCPICKTELGWNDCIFNNGDVGVLNDSQQTSNEFYSDILTKQTCLLNEFSFDIQTNKIKTGKFKISSFELVCCEFFIKGLIKLDSNPNKVKITVVFQILKKDIEKNEYSFIISSKNDNYKTVYSIKDRVSNQPIFQKTIDIYNIYEAYDMFEKLNKYSLLI